MSFFRKPLNWWLLCCGAYAAFISIFSFLYPIGLDEYFGIGIGWGEALNRALFTFWTHSPKIGVFIGAVVLCFGKWFFVLLNPLAQLGVCAGIFYLVYMRLPDAGDYKDLPVFILIMLLSVFAAPVPSNTIFWIGGAVNYSWVFLFFLLFLCALRAAWEQKKFIFDGGFLGCALAAAAAVCLGLSNENNSPAALGVCGVFFVLAAGRKIKLPVWFFCASAGCAAGFGLMFLSPALKQRVAETTMGFMKEDLLTKLFFHINHFHIFIKANMLVFAFCCIGLLICGIDWDKKAFRNKNYLLALAAAALGFGLFFILFLTPFVGGRNYYSAAMMSIIALLFLLEYVKEEYGFAPAKYAAAAALIYAVVQLPLFAIPYINLRGQEVGRQALLAQAERGGKTAYLPYYISVSAGGRENDEILFYDVMYATPQERRLYFKTETVPVILLPLQNVPPTNSFIL